MGRIHAAAGHRLIRARAVRRPDSIERTITVPTARPGWDQVLVWFLAALRLPARHHDRVTLDPERRAPVAATMHAEDGAWAEVRL